MTIYGTNNPEALTGTTGNDYIVGYDGSDTIDGGAGNDTVNGGYGNNTYLFGKGDGLDILQDFYDNEAWDGTTNGKLNTLEFKAGVNVTDVGARRSGDDLIFNILGVDTFKVVNYFYNDSPFNSYNPLQQVKFSDGTTWDLNAINTAAFAGTTGADYIKGATWNDTIDGGAGNDTINGGYGNNTYLFGKGDGLNILQDFYDNKAWDGTTNGKLNTLQFKSGVAVGDVSLARSGNDLLISILGKDTLKVVSFFYNNSLVNSYNPLQQITFANGVAWGLLDILDHTLTGGIQNGTINDDILHGTLDADAFYGGLGDDIYFVNNLGDTVTETSTLADEIDTVNSTVNFTLGANTENLTLTGSAAINGTGNNLGNIIIGNKGANVLDGKTGIDTMMGGAGNDTYYVDSMFDIVTEKTNGGTDTVKSSVSFELMLGIENLTLTGSTDTIGYGNSADNVIVGNSGKNTIYGKTGADTMSGGNGADIFIYKSAEDTGITAATRDTIKDFKTSQGDKINLENLDANSSTAGNQAFTKVTVGGTFSGSFSGQALLYFDKTNQILYGNNDADSAADFSIKLTGVTTLAATDFVL